MAAQKKGMEALTHIAKSAAGLDEGARAEERLTDATMTAMADIESAEGTHIHTHTFLHARVHIYYT